MLDALADVLPILIGFVVLLVCIGIAADFLEREARAMR